MEAKGEIQKAFFEKSQNSISNALRQAEKSSYELFMAQLSTDQAHFRSNLVSVSSQNGLFFGVVVAAVVVVVVVVVVKQQQL